MDIDRQRSWLIDHLKTGTELRDHHRSPAPMAVAGAAVQCHKKAGILLRTESGPHGLPISAQVMKKFEAKVNPVINTDYQLTGKDRIFGENGQRRLTPAQSLNKALKSLFGSIPLQQPLQTGDIEFQGQSAAHLDDQLSRQICIQHIFNLVWIEGEKSMRLDE